MMAPQHGEIVKDIGDGFSIAWDTTRVDKAKLATVQALARELSAELGRIIDETPATAEKTESASAGKPRAAGTRRRPRVAA
jgi:hypothetical protein